MSLDTSKLVNVKPTPDGWQCQCPQCARESRDLKGRNHLRIYRSGAFNCCVDNSPLHNRQIRALLRGYVDGTESEEIVYIEPRLEVETVYPESTLSKLLPDYTYWLGRGMREDVLRKLENGVAPADEKSKLSGRTIFPLRNPDGIIVGFSGRLLTDSSYAPKWKHLARIGKLVYPWNVTGADIIAARTVILTESIGDTLALLSYDVKPVLCIFGLNLSGAIISTLIGADVKRVIISLNRDDDPRKGQAAADKIANKLGNFFTDVRVVLPPEGTKDWGAAAEKRDDSAFARFREENGL